MRAILFLRVQITPVSPRDEFTVQNSGTVCQPCLRKANFSSSQVYWTTKGLKAANALHSWQNSGIYIKSRKTRKTERQNTTRSRCEIYHTKKTEIVRTWNRSVKIAKTGNVCGVNWEVIPRPFHAVAVGLRRGVNPLPWPTSALKYSCLLKHLYFTKHGSTIYMKRRKRLNWLN